MNYDSGACTPGRAGIKAKPVKTQLEFKSGAVPQL
jgi:hypothetical protein